MMPQYSPPPTSGQRQNYGSPGAMPNIGMQMPIPSATPAAAGATSAGLPPPTLAAKPYPYQAVPTIPRERGVPDSWRRGLTRIITTLFIIIVCVIIGGGIYYFVTQTETTPPPENTIDNTPPSIQDVPASSTTTTGATITWKTDEPTRGEVKYWKTATENPMTRLDENLSTSHSVPLPGLDPDTTYYFKVTSRDATGNETTEEGSFKTLAAADETEPSISGVGISSITESSAIITWTTDETATSQVKYGQTEEYGSETPENTNLVRSHSVTLTELDDDTTYYFKVISKDAAGNEAELAESQTFTTKSTIPVGYEIDDLAPEFALEDVNGTVWKLSDYRGKIVMVNFWATWCQPCVNELPHFQEIAQDWSGDLQIFAITSIDENQSDKDVRYFLQDNPEYTFTFLLDPDGKVAEEYGFVTGTTIPRTFFIDAECIIKEIQEDPFSSPDDIEEILDTLQTQ